MTNIQPRSQSPKNRSGLDLKKLSERLGNVEHFRRLSSIQRNEIVTAGQVEFHPKGMVIFREGDPCSGLFVLFKGQVNLSMIGIQGQECIITIIRPVIMFNEVAVLDGGPNPVTATAVRDCATWRLGHDRYMMLMEQYPEMGIGLLNVLASRHRLMLSRFEDLFSRTVQARTAKVLLEVSRNGLKVIDRKMHANQELAARAATCPEVFSRSLKSLREIGVIECDRATILVKLPNRLAEVAMVEPPVHELYSEN
jgi:CRP/FNR family transcriptional regulator